MKESLGFVKRETQDFADLPGRQFSLCVLLEEKRFKQRARTRRFVQAELLGELVGNFDGNDHDGSNISVAGMQDCSYATANPLIWAISTDEIKG